MNLSEITMEYEIIIGKPVVIRLQVTPMYRPNLTYFMQKCQKSKSEENQLLSFSCSRSGIKRDGEQSKADIYALLDCFEGFGE